MEREGQSPDITRVIFENILFRERSKHKNTYNYYFKFTPIIPPKAPEAIPISIITILSKPIEKFELAILEVKYKIPIYKIPSKIPHNNSF